MNRCFFMGRIQSEIDFKFVINGKHDSIAIFSICLIDKNDNVKIVAYDDNADYCLRNLQKGDMVVLEGYLKNEKNSLYVVIYYIDKK